MDENLVRSAGRKVGVRPVRLKGFHRAVKRGESWAVHIWGLRDRPFQYLLGLHYRTVDIGVILATKNTLLENLKKTDSWLGGVLLMPTLSGGRRKKSRYRGKGKK